MRGSGRLVMVDDGEGERGQKGYVIMGGGGGSRQQAKGAEKEQKCTLSSSSFFSLERMSFCCERGDAREGKGE
jgi:hypothetical protein